VEASGPTTEDKAERPTRWSIWAEALFLVSITAAAAVPLCYLVAWVDALNDKLGGPHANRWSYLKVVLVAALAAAVAALARRVIGRPRTFEGEVFVPVLLGCAALATITLTFCLWGRWVFEYQLL
jgi:hypothetical protein